jgi:dTDP-4-dehydrorhamnose reductase
MSRDRASARPERPPLPGLPQVWAGPECARVDVHGRTVDQLALTGVDERPELFDLLGDLGVSAARVPALWERVERRHGRYDWRVTDEVLGRLQERGIEPVVGLVHHGFGPAWARADLTTRRFPDWSARFADYAAAAARRYPWVRWWLPVNEPLTTARMTGLYGLWWPHRRTAADFVRLLAAMCLGVRDAREAIRGVNPDARLIVNDDVGVTRSTPAVADQAAFDNARRWLGWDLILGRLDAGHELAGWLEHFPDARRAIRSLRDRPARIDALGVDHYVTSDRFLDDRLELYPEDRHGGNGQISYADVELVRVLGSDDGGFDLAIDETYGRYGLPIVLAEVGLVGHALDEVAWWREAWGAAVDARARGIPVEAVTAWAAFGATDWDSLLTLSHGRYVPGLWDARSEPPRPRPVARSVAAAARRNRARGRWVGWWRRDDAVLYPVADTATNPARRPRTTSKQVTRKRSR